MVVYRPIRKLTLESNWGCATVKRSLLRTAVHQPSFQSLRIQRRPRA